MPAQDRILSPVMAEGTSQRETVVRERKRKNYTGERSAESVKTVENNVG